MPVIQVQHNQTLLDIAIQHIGAAEACVALALANNTSVTNSLLTNQGLNLVEVQNRNIVRVFASDGRIPANGSIAETLPEGIGYMEIGTTFKIY